MLKLLIVDDEFYFREAIKMTIPYKEIGYQICDEARNGLEALEKVELHKPHVVLVDINMPIMDGLEFVQEVKSKGLDIKIIILTGYSEFKYAKEAIELGVSAFILKPIDESDLKDKLIEIKNLISKESSIRIEFEMLKKQVKESKPVFKEKLLNELLNGNTKAKVEDMEEQCRFVGINIDAGYFLVFTVEIDGAGLKIWDEEQKFINKYAVCDIILKLMQGYSAEICFDSNDRICVIVSSKDDNSEIIRELEGLCKRIAFFADKHLKVNLTIGIGNKYYGMSSITTSYKESVIALKYKSMVENSAIVYDSVADNKITTTFYPFEHRNQLLMNMRLEKTESTIAIIEEIFNLIKQKKVHYDIVFIVSMELASICFEYLVENGLGCEILYDNEYFNYLRDIHNNKSINESLDIIKKIFIQVVEYVATNKRKKVSKIVHSVKEYVENNYSDFELCIDEIAKNLFLNYSYLCFAFKKDTGLTINDYITEYRIEKAKGLFDNGNTLITNVAYNVGYSDSNYFGKCFKKRIGMSPSNYVKNIGKN